MIISLVYETLQNWYGKKGLIISKNKSECIFPIKRTQRHTSVDICMPYKVGSKCHLQKNDVVANKSYLFAIGATKSTPVLNQYVETEMPLSSKRNELNDLNSCGKYMPRTVEP